METKLVNDLTYTTRNTRGSPVLFERGLTHTSLLLCLPASALRDDLSPEDPNLSSNFHAQASEETGPKKGPIWRGLLRRSEQKHVCSLASRRPPSSLTKPQGQKGSQRPGQPPEPAPSCLCSLTPQGSRPCPRLLPTGGNHCSLSRQERSRQTPLHATTQGCRHAGDRAQPPPDL